MTCIGKTKHTAKEVYSYLSPLHRGNGQHLHVDVVQNDQVSMIKSKFPYDVVHYPI